MKGGWERGGWMDGCGLSQSSRGTEHVSICNDGQESIDSTCYNIILCNLLKSPILISLSFFLEAVPR